MSVNPQIKSYKNVNDGYKLKFIYFNILWKVCQKPVGCYLTVGANSH